MASVTREQAAAYMVWWTKQYGTNQQQIDAERALRDLRRGTA